jgi:hypothetical protein
VLVDLLQQCERRFAERQRLVQLVTIGQHHIDGRLAPQHQCNAGGARPRVAARSAFAIDLLKVTSIIIVTDNDTIAIKTEKLGRIAELGSRERHRLHLRERLVQRPQQGRQTQRLRHLWHTDSQRNLFANNKRSIGNKSQCALFGEARVVSLVWRSGIIEAVVGVIVRRKCRNECRRAKVLHGERFQHAAVDARRHAEAHGAGGFGEFNGNKNGIFAQIGVVQSVVGRGHAVNRHDVAAISTR